MTPGPILPHEIARFSCARTVRDPVTGQDVVVAALDTGPSLTAHGVRVVGTVLAVHGNPTWSYLWRHVLAATEAAALDAGAGWRVVAVDQLEMGLSTRTGADRSLATRVADLGRFTDALGLEGPVVTLGHDWGGVVSLGWAVDHPQLLAGVVLTNTAVHHPAGARVPAALRVAMHPALVDRGTRDTRAFLEGTLALAHPALGSEARSGYRAPYATAARRAGIAGFVRDIPADPAHPSRPELDRIAAGVAALAVPALVLWGPRDPVFQERYLADLEARLPHAGVHRFEGAGHLLPEDADVAGALLDFLADLDAPAGEPRVEADAPSTAPFTPLGAALEDRADDDAVALVELRGRRRTVSWRLLASRVEALARGLVATGVRPGDRVSLLVPPGADLTASLYACLRIGAVAVVADAGLGVRGLTRAVRSARPQWIIGIPAALRLAAVARWPGRRILAGAGAPALVGAVATLADLARLGAGEVLPPVPGPEEPAVVLFTSGSTGPAKGVRYTHRGLAGVRDALRGAYAIGPQSGLVAGFAPFALLGPALGCRTATPDMEVTRPATLTAAGLADAVDAIGADAVFCSPAALTNVVATAAGRTLPGVRLVLSAGAPVGLPLLAAADAVFPNAEIHTPYGMTESLLVTDVTRAQIRAAGDGEGVCVGRPVDGVGVRIAPLDALGRPSSTPTADAGITGEVQIAAPHMLAGYDRLWRTQRASRAGTAAEPWHRTGDVGHLDVAGRLWIEGRLPHVIAADGGPVTPVGVEQRAERADGVRRAAAVGVGPAGAQQVVVVAETGGRAGLAPSPIADAVRAGAGRRIAAVLAVPVLPTDIRHRSKIDRTRVAAWATGVLSGGRPGRL